MGEATLVGRLSGIRTQSGQTKVKNGLTALIFSPNLEVRAVLRLVSLTLEFALQLRKITENLSQGSRKSASSGSTLRQRKCLPSCSDYGFPISVNLESSLSIRDLTWSER